jgi:arylformamidase
MNAQPRYDEFSDAQMSRHFMPRLAVPDHEAWLTGDLELTARTKARLRPHLDRRYGPGARQVADLYPAPSPGAPLLVFFHGGYWRALSKDHVGFLAGPMHEANVALVVPNYDLCPAVTLGEIVEEARQALAFALSQAKALNADDRLVYVGGNSAGAHLAAMLLAAEAAQGAVGGAPIKGLFLLTGIYDLRPILRVQVNDDVRLSSKDALALSPLYLPMPGEAKALLAVGADEPAMWIEQSRRLAARFTAEGHWAELMIMPRLHHFSVTRSLCERASPLCRALIEFMR